MLKINRELNDKEEFTANGEVIKFFDGFLKVYMKV